CNIYYLTGYDGWSLYTPQALVLFQDHDPVFITRSMDCAGVRMTSCLADDAIIGYGEHLVQTNDGHPFEVVAKHIEDTLGSGAIRIALETESYYLTVRSYQQLQVLLPNTRFCDSDLLVNWIRFIKSEKEQLLMREAGRLLTNAMNRTIETIKDGAFQRDAVAVAYAENIAGTTNIGGSYTSSPAFFLADERIKTPHLPWTDERIENDSQINLELMGNRLRYQCTMGRTVFVGDPPKRLIELEQIICEGINDVLSFIKPGTTCHEVADCLLSFLKTRGIEKESRCGYSQGIAYPPTGGELTASIRRGDTTVLKEGATMHLLPAIWSDNTSIIISEPFIVTKEGAEPLCSVPRQLFIK
ncbi:MAG: Xaa-Pro peptidase family protein, partial [Pseudomonadota bacterium]